LETRFKENFEFITRLKGIAFGTYHVIP
jgi:hypothetical protein